MNRPSKTALIIILIFCSLASVDAARLGVSTAAAGSASIKVAGLQAPVNVRRDDRGIAYIEAQNDHDLYFAQGYVTATDRLWQMDVLRRTARGELSELLGKAVFEEDKRHRLLGMAKLSEEKAAQMDETSRALFQAYADGVNAWISTLDEKTLPTEFRVLKYQPRKWTLADSIVIGFLMAESLSTSWQQDIMRAAFTDLPADLRDELFIVYSDLDTPVVGSDRLKAKPAKAAKSMVSVSDGASRLALASEQTRERSLSRVGMWAEDMAASNNWVVSGKRTVTGKPLLSNDPHLAPSVPNIWYMVHLSAPGLRVSGVSIPGINGVIIGHNDRIAWGMTNLGPDVQDLYLEKFDKEKFDAKNPPKYQTPKGWEQAEVRCEDVKVRKNPTSPETETVCVDVAVTRHGPIILDRGKEKYALRWSIHDTQANSFASFHYLNRAKNWKEFTAAISNFSGATQNFIYADIDGHIGYYGSGRIPIRRSGDGSLPYDGTKDDGEWTGYIPFDKLPHVYDPPSGMIVTANSRVVGKDYPYHLTYGWSVPYRQKRINDLLKVKPKLTIDDFRATLGDVYAIGGDIFAKNIVKLFNGKSDDAKLQESLDLLAKWDGRVSADSRAALLVNEMRDIFGNRLVAAKIGEEKARQYRWTNRNLLLDRIVTQWPMKWLPKEYAGWQDFVKACAAETRTTIARKYGADESKWTFGNAVQVKFNHPMTSAPLVGNQFKIDPFPQQGNGYTGGIGPTVNVGPSVSMRMIVDMSNLDNSQQGLPVGQSGDPKSTNYKDQIDDWRRVTPRVFPFSRKAVDQTTKSVITMEP
ncbi:MAG: penicillin acylase family protein [Acidobacteria bacterium]|nr:penicillin acylase family protein [Acidobacteriota bacterium]